MNNFCTAIFFFEWQTRIPKEHHAKTHIWLISFLKPQVTFLLPPCRHSQLQSFCCHIILCGFAPRPGLGLVTIRFPSVQYQNVFWIFPPITFWWRLKKYLASVQNKTSFRNGLGNPSLGNCLSNPSSVVPTPKFRNFLESWLTNKSKQTFC